jgi:hypothetical protein
MCSPPMSLAEANTILHRKRNLLTRIRCLSDSRSEGDTTNASNLLTDRAVEAFHTVSTPNCVNIRFETNKPNSSRSFA